MVALLLAAVVGAAAGWLAGWAARAAVLDDPTPPATSRDALLLAGLTVVVVLAAAVGAEWAGQRGALLDNLRRTPPRRRRWRVGPVDVVALALAAAAGYQVVVGGTAGGLAVAAPLLLALACGLLAGRLVLPVSARVGTALLHRGRLAGGLAALELARRPHARPLLTVVTVAVALAGLAVSGVDTTRRAAQERAALELGAAQVLRVASTPAATRAAVHAADPDGRWAMAAARQRVGIRTMVAVEAERLAAVATWPAGAPDVAEVARALRPAANRQVTVAGGEATVDISVTHPLGAPIRLTLRLVEPDGTIRDVTTLVGPVPGRRGHVVTVPGCASGCRLAWLSFPTSPDGLRLHGLRQRDGDGEREVLAPRDFATPARWRSGFTTNPGELRLTHGDGWLAATLPAERSPVHRRRTAPAAGRHPRTAAGGRRRAARRGPARAVGAVQHPAPGGGGGPRRRPARRGGRRGSVRPRVRRAVLRRGGRPRPTARCGWPRTPPPRSSGGCGPACR